MSSDNSVGNQPPGAQDTVQPSTLDYMLAAKRWLVWNTDKQPFYVDGTPRHGTLDTAADQAALGSYQDASAAVHASNGRFVGMGFALGPDGTGRYWQGVDNDDILQNHLSDLANDAPGYVEFSPSGNGQHAIGYGRYFQALGANGSGIEAYATGRYFTFSDHCIRDGALTCLAAWVEGVVSARHSGARATDSVTSDTLYVDPQTVTELRSALNAIPADDYDVWVRMGCALHELGNVGRELWLTWSQTSEKYTLGDVKKWNTFKSDRTGYQAVFAEAQRRGWVNPNSNSAQLNPIPAIEWNPDVLFDQLSFDWHSTEPLPPDLIEGLVADEEVTILGGHGGIGKGFLSLQLACAVSLGGEVFGHRAPQAKRVLYYSAEDGRKRIGHRLRRLLESYEGEEQERLEQNLRLIDASDLDPLGGGSSHGLVPLPDYEKLRKMVEAFDPQLVVIDGASDTFDGNEIARRDVRGFVKLLRRIHPARRIGVLLIVHIDRASARGHITNDDGYAGSTQWHNSSRRRLFLQRFVEKDPDTKEEVSETILLRVMKNQDGPPAPDMEVMRQPSGFWQLAVSLVGGLAQPTEDHSATILVLIGEYYRRGQFMSTSLAANATTGVYDTLRGDQRFPRSLKKKMTAELLRRLERNGELTREEYRRSAGGKAERWRVASSPSFTLPVEADVQSVPSEQ